MLASCSTHCTLFHLLRPVSYQHTSQLPGEQAAHASIFSATYIMSGTPLWCDITVTELKLTTV